MKIAIDGPAGAGKSTISKRVAKELGINYLDTGAMYRAVALQVLRERFDPENVEQVLRAAEEADLSFQENKICIQGKSVAEEIRTPEVNRLVSKVAALPALRAWMVKRQQEIANQCSVVMDGRDIGTVVLPQADHKFYLDASIDIRAERRFLEQESGPNSQSLEEIKEDIRRRDQEDRNRKTGPLAVAKDAVVIDTTRMSVEEVVHEMIKHIKE